MRSKVKTSIGDYSAFTSPGGVRFMVGSKLASEAAVPEEIVYKLRKSLESELPPAPVVQKFPMPTEEEKARMRAESLQVKPELQMTPEEVEVRTVLPEVPEEVPHAQLPEETAPTVSEPDFLDEISIHTAPLNSMVQALYDRFGIYTVYLGALPRADETNPLTGEAFNRYHLGIAYQAALKVQRVGVPEPSRGTLDAGRYAEEHFQESFEPVAYTMGAAREQNTFDYRTSVKGANENPTGSLNGAVSRAPRGDEDEPILEPPLGGKPIIRPVW